MSNDNEKSHEEKSSINLLAVLRQRDRNTAINLYVGRLGIYSKEKTSKEIFVSVPDTNRMMHSRNISSVYEACDQNGLEKILRREIVSQYQVN